MIDMNQTQQCQNSSFFPDFASTKSFIYIPNLYYSFWYAKFKQISLYKISPCIPNYIIEKMVCIFNKKLTFEKKQIHTKLIIQNLVCKLSRNLSQNHKKIHTKLHNSHLVCIYPKKDIKLPQIYIPKSTFTFWYAFSLFLC